MDGLLFSFFSSIVGAGEECAEVGCGVLLGASDMRLRKEEVGLINGCVRAAEEVEDLRAVCAHGLVAL